MVHVVLYGLAINQSDCFCLIIASNGSDTCNQMFDDYKELRSQYRSSLRHFVISQENEKIKTLCKASEVDEKLFWQMLKGSRVQRKTTCFIENDKLINTGSEILDMWASHFATLGQSTINSCFIEEFRQHIELSVKQTLDDCLHTLTCSEGLFTCDIVKEV